jgi:hypothetical protein
MRTNSRPRFGQIQIGRLTKRIEPMRGSAFKLVLYSVACDALPLMAHPHR